MLGVVECAIIKSSSSAAIAEFRDWSGAEGLSDIKNFVKFESKVTSNTCWGRLKLVFVKVVRQSNKGLNTSTH